MRFTSAKCAKNAIPTPDHRTVEAREEEPHIRFEDLVQRLTMLPLRRVFCRGCDRFRYFVK
jgi:hypothetical protein